MLKVSTLIFVLLFVSLSSVKAAPETATAEMIPWEPWSDAAFARAKKEKKYLILDLQAVWCHWCHVMAEKTYKDPAVVKIIRESYIPIQVDQDSRPDLSARFEKYGWPATIIFTPNGKTIRKKRGYLFANEMVALLDEVIKNPGAPDSEDEDDDMRFSKTPRLASALRKEMEANIAENYDPELGGWALQNRSLDWLFLEYAMRKAARGDKRLEKWARQTLDAEFKLIDPVWGGAYQYSAKGNWDNPHYEKIMNYQMEIMRIYAMAHTQFKETKYLKAANDIDRFVTTFLRGPEGAFYTSQDADLVQGEHSAGYFSLNDEARRAKGIPRVDKHQYARENGWVVRGEVALYQATGDKKHLETAETAAVWALKNRRREGGGFSHDEKDVAGPYLGDNVAMADGLLQLYLVTEDQKWKTPLEETLTFIEATFKDKGSKKKSGAGYFSTIVAANTPAVHVRQGDENIALARLTNKASQVFHMPKYRQMAEHAMKFLVTKEYATRFFLMAGVWLADDDLQQSRSLAKRVK